MKNIMLNKKERQLKKEIESGEWKVVPNLAEEIKKYQKYALNTLNKNKKININIRISDLDYEKIKIKAVGEGLPYQTLISSIIHKYLTGQLKTG